MHVARAEIVSNVWKIDVAEGDLVGPGDVLAVLESMKMEIPLVSSVHGRVSTILVELGQIVQEGDAVIEIAETVDA